MRLNVFIAKKEGAADQQKRSRSRRSERALGARTGIQKRAQQGEKRDYCISA